MGPKVSPRASPKVSPKVAGDGGSSKSSDTDNATDADSATATATDGRSIILLRGLGRGHGHWGWFLEEISNALGRHNVHFFDLPGNGDQWERPSFTTVQENVDYLIEQAKGTPRPWHILAISMGGMIAYEWARQCPEDVASLALINSSFSGRNGFYERLLPKNYLPILAMLMASDPEGSEKKILDIVVNDPLARARALPSLAEFSKKHPLSRSNFLRQLATASRVKGYEPPPVPVMLFASAKDRLVSPNCSQSVAKAWKCPIKIHPQAGHDIPIDDANWLLQNYVNWLTSL